MQTTTPAPVPQNKSSAASKPSLIKRLFAWLFAKEAPSKSKKPYRGNKRRGRPRNYRSSSTNRGRSSSHRRRSPRDSGRNINRRRSGSARRASNSRGQNNKQNGKNYRRQTDASNATFSESDANKQPSQSTNTESTI